MNVPDQEPLKQLHVLSCFVIFLLAYIGLKDPSPLWTYGNTNTVNTAAWQPKSYRNKMDLIPKYKVSCITLHSGESLNPQGLLPGKANGSTVDQCTSSKPNIPSL